MLEMKEVGDLERVNERKMLMRNNRVKWWSRELKGIWRCENSEKGELVM